MKLKSSSLGVISVYHPFRWVAWLRQFCRRTRSNRKSMKGPQYVDLTLLRAKQPPVPNSQPNRSSRQRRNRPCSRRRRSNKPMPAGSATERIRPSSSLACARALWPTCTPTALVNGSRQDNRYVAISAITISSSDWSSKRFVRSCGALQSSCSSD